MIHYREGSAADRDAILALRRRCFANENVEKQDPAYWDWQFADGRLFLAVFEGRPIAHIGFIPRSLVVGGETVRTALAIDAMTDPGFRRRGIFRRLMSVARDEIAKQYRISTAWQIRRSVLPAMMDNGWMPMLSAPVMAKPLLLSFAGENGGAASTMLNDPRQHVVQQLGLAKITTRRTTLKGFDTLAIVDAAWSDNKELRRLLRSACATAKKEGVTLAAALVTLRHPLLPILLRAGFLPTPHRFRLLVNVFDASLHDAVRRNRWALLWADTDHL
ncbi:MAG TPA: GNAT family N-acetyltransferase [Thermoanaerobaculia bacterium]